MWVETRNGLINTDHVARITTGKNFIYFYGPETPKSGDAMKDMYRDLIGDIKCATEEEAKARYASIQEELKNNPRTPP